MHLAPSHAARSVYAGIALAAMVTALEIFCRHSRNAPTVARTTARVPSYHAVPRPEHFLPTFILHRQPPLATSHSQHEPEGIATRCK